MSPEDMGMGLKSCVGVFLVKLVRIHLQYKWGTFFRQEWFWRMEEVTKRNGKGVWMREVEKVLRRFDVSLDWLMERITMREEEMEKIKRDDEMDESEKNKILLSRDRRTLMMCWKRLRLSSTLTSSTISRKQSPRRF